MSPYDMQERITEIDRVIVAARVWDAKMAALLAERDSLRKAICAYGQSTKSET